MEYVPGRLVISMFRSNTKAGRRMRLLPRVEKIMRSGHVEEPEWLQPMQE